MTGIFCFTYIALYKICKQNWDKKFLNIFKFLEFIITIIIIIIIVISREQGFLMCFALNLNLGIILRLLVFDLAFSICSLGPLFDF